MDIKVLQDIMGFLTSEKNASKPLNLCAKKIFKKISTQVLTVLTISVILHIEQRKRYKKGTDPKFFWTIDNNDMNDKGEMCYVNA